jgi:hypothetical protein
MGSITQRRPESPAVVPASSPYISSPGTCRANSPRINSSTARSASVTSVPSGLRELCTSPAKNRSAASPTRQVDREVEQLLIDRRTFQRAHESWT